MLNKSKYILYLRFFKVATLCLMSALHTLGIISTSFIRTAFPTVLKEFPHMLSTGWLLFLHSVVQLIPNHLNWVEVRLLLKSQIALSKEQSVRRPKVRNIVIIKLRGNMSSSVQHFPFCFPQSVRFPAVHRLVEWYSVLFQWPSYDLTYAH